MNRTLEAFSESRSELQAVASAYPHEQYRVTFEPRVKLPDGSYRSKVYCLWKLDDPADGDMHFQQWRARRAEQERP